MKTILLFTISTAFTTVLFCQISTNELVTNYAFNNGNTNDEAGRNLGIVSGTVLNEDRSGKTNMAYIFQYVNQAQIMIPNHADIHFSHTSDFTVAFE